MIRTAIRNKNKGLSIIASVLMGAAVFGLQSCSSSDGASAVVPDVTLAAASLSEGNSGTTNLDFTVTLSAVTTAVISVAYATSDDSATAGQDYTATTGTLTVAANTTSATISVPVTGDLAVELDETFNLEISAAVGATIASGSQSVAGTILTDDLAGYYTGSATVNEAASSLVITDPGLQVIVAEDRVVIINLANNLVYIAPMTTVTSSGFSTTARIYKDGDFTTTTDITATFIAGASISLTLAGTGDYTTGTVSLAYSAENSVAPLVFAVETWDDGATIGSARINFESNDAFASILTRGGVLSTTLRNCETVSSTSLSPIISEQTGRLRSFIATGIVGCDDGTLDGTSLNGYFTTFTDTLADDRILFVWFNDTGVHAASLTEI